MEQRQFVNERGARMPEFDRLTEVRLFEFRMEYVVTIGAERMRIAKAVSRD